MWYRFAKGIGGIPVKETPDVSEEMIRHLLEQGRSLDEFYIDSKTRQSDLWNSLVSGTPLPEEDIKPYLETLEDQLEERHVGDDAINMFNVEKGKGGMYMRNGEGIYQYNSGKGAPNIFVDNLSPTKTWV